MRNNLNGDLRFSDLWYLFVSKLWIMILVAAVVGGGIFGFRYFTYRPVYKSTASIYILRQEGANDETNYNSDFSLALSVVNDCTTLLTSRSVLNEVIEQNNLNYTYGDLCKKISINNPQSTRYLEISVSTYSPAESKKIVDAVCNIGKDQIVSIMGFNQVNIVDEGTLPDSPTNSFFSIVIVLAALVAFLLTYVICILCFILDDRISDPDDVERYLQLSVLGTIPNTGGKKSSYGGYNADLEIERKRYYTKSR